MTIKELYLERKEKIKAERKRCQEVLSNLEKIRKEIEQKHIERAKLNAEAHFNCAHAGELLEANQSLQAVEVEDKLLRCPEENLHRKPEGQYYHCKLCGFVFDDTSPAHF